MTDNDVIKGLECLRGKEMLCVSCPYFRAKGLKCRMQVANDVLDLINRQKAEIERLKSYKNLYEDSKAEYLETIKAIKNYKAEVIKAFAERLKENLECGLAYDGGILHHVIDKLAKEMTEGADK